MAQNTLEADIKAGKLTAESVANAHLSTELGHHLWRIILVADQNLGHKFHKLFLSRKGEEERLKRIKQVCPTNWTLHSLVRNFVGMVAAKDPGAAEKLVAVLKGDSNTVSKERDIFGGEVKAGPQMLEQCADTRSSLNLSAVPDATKDQQALTPSLGPEQFAAAWQIMKDNIWIDKFGLPLPLESDMSLINDIMSKGGSLASRKEAEQRLVLLSCIQRGQVMRWNHDDHLAGAYGDPNRRYTRSETGRIVQRPLNELDVDQEHGGQETIMLSIADLQVLRQNPCPLQTELASHVLDDHTHELEGDCVLMQGRGNRAGQLGVVAQQSSSLSADRNEYE